MESINPNFTWEEIQGLYQEVYKLQRLPGGSHCEVAMEEQLQEEILASIREHLWLGMPLENEGEHLEPNTTILSIELTKDLQPESGAETMRCWPLPGMPTKKPWLQLLSLRRGLKGWAVLPADSDPEAANILAVGTQDPESVEERTPS